MTLRYEGSVPSRDVLMKVIVKQIDIRFVFSVFPYIYTLLYSIVQLTFTSTYMKQYSNKYSNRYTTWEMFLYFCYQLKD